MKTIDCRGYILDFSRTLVMGILNITPDSFSDGGKYLNICNAIEHAKKMQKEGADIIDIGGESSRPGAIPVSMVEERKRVLPVVKALLQHIHIPISIDTYKPEIAKDCLQAGAHIINDITGLANIEMVKIIKKYNAPVVVMHMKGTPQNMQKKPYFEDVIEETYSFFKAKIAFCHLHGIDQVIIDPGIGFGKRLVDNLTILKKLEKFTTFGVPILMGVSNKSFIGALTGEDVNNRVVGTIASETISILNGANIIRTHNVKEAKKMMSIVDSVKYL